MHVASSTTPNIIRFSAESWAAFVRSSLEWVSFDTKESQVAAIAVEKYELKENVFVCQLMLATTENVICNMPTEETLRELARVKRGQYSRLVCTTLWF